ncbi:MAG: alpha/beta hydrolase-fold protein, partial [Pricia sp.]
LKEDRTLNIYLPKSFHIASKDHTYPLLLLYGEHGNQFFLTTSGIVEHLSSVHRMPEAVVVSFNESKNYAPDVYANGMWGPNREMLVFNADPDRFIKHLKEELFPYLEQRYRVTDFKMIVGVSGSSIFPMHTFAKAPELFQGHVIMAGADMVGMGYEQDSTFIDAFVERLKTSSVSRSYLYFGVADDDLTWDQAYPKNLEELESRLSPFASDIFRFQVEVIPDEIHYDSYIKGLLSSFALIFPKKIWSTDYVDLIKKPGNALKNIDAFHQELSNRYGFAILPKVERWNNQNSLDKIGERLMGKERTKEAIELFERIVEYRPKSAKALNELAKALEADHQYEKALGTMQKCVSLAETFEKENAEQYREYFERLKTTVANFKN